MTLLLAIIAAIVITVIASWLASNRTARRQPTINPQRYAAAVERMAQERAERERRIQAEIDAQIAALDIQLAPIWRVVREERAERLLTAREN